MHCECLPLALVPGDQEGAGLRCCGLNGFGARGARVSALRQCEVGACRAPKPGERVLIAPGHCMTGASLVFFGAATKCAMCYVAWFIIFLQATKLICSPIV